MSLLIAKQRLPWQRYWVPWDGTVHGGWDGSGFITDPRGSWGKVFNPQLQSTGEVINRPFTVLSGLPGMGKTQAVRQLKDEWTQKHPEEDLIYIEGRTLDGMAAIYRATIDSPQWQSTVVSGRRLRLLIDGVDEAIMRHIDLVGGLLQALEQQPMDRIRLILVCRAAEWRESDNQRFAILWPEEIKSEATSAPADEKAEKTPDLTKPVVWELCHLRREDAEIAATACGVDTRSFLKSVFSRRIEALAARPVTLRMLLDDFKADPNSNATYHQLYRRSIWQLCGEVNEERGRYLAPYPARKQVYRAASRLAACLIFSRKTVIVRSKATAENPPIELLFSDVEGTDVAEGNSFQVTPSLLDFILDTPLFNFRGPNYGFEQATYAEFLAADYVARCEIDQLRSLFCIRLNDRDVTSPHLAEVAARVAILNDVWCRHLCQHDPEVLFRTDLSPLSDELKALVVDSYLRSVETEEAFDHRGLNKFYASLKHPGLAEQLRPYINEPSFNLIVRRIAIDMAGDCRLSELENDLWARARAADTCIRWIGPTLGKLTGAHAMTELMDVLEGKFPPSTFRTLSGVAIETLVPSRLAVRDVLGFLQIRSRKEGADAHHIACNYYLAENLSREDLVPALRWLGTVDGAFDSLHSLNLFAERVFEEALKHLDDDAIAKEVALLWMHCVDKHLPHPSGRDHYRREYEPQRGLSILEYRHALVSALVHSGISVEKHLYLQFEGLLDSSDSKWLLEQLEVADTPYIPALAKICVVYLRPEEARKHADLLLRLYDRIPELRAALPPVEEGLDFVTSYERLFERGRQESERQSHELRGRRAKPQKRLDAINHFLGMGDSQSAKWVSLSQWLWVREEEDPKEDKTDHSDVTTSLGWREASQEVRHQLKKAAREFLLHHKEGRLKINQSSNYCIAAYAAIRLFWPDFRQDPELAKAIAAHWSRSIFNAFRDENKDHPELVAWCYAHRPRLGAAILLAKMKANSENGLADFALEPYRLCWDRRLAHAVIRWILKWKHSVRNSFRLVHWLVMHDQEAAENLIEQARVIGKPLSTHPHERDLVLAAWLLMPQRYWASLRPVIEHAPSEQTRAAFLDACYELSHGDRPILGQLSDEQLVDLGKLVFRLFPSREDPVHPQGEVHEVGEKDNAATFRQAILNHLVARATPAACEAVLEIAQDNSSEDQLWIRWRHSEALRAASDKLVPVRKPSDITRLVLSGAAVLIDSEEDLVHAILGSLKRLEARMLTHPTEWRALWNEDDHKPLESRQHPSGRTPKVETVFTDVVTQWLRDDLGMAKGLVLNREVEISKDKILDIKIDITARGDGRPLCVPIECKRCIHSDVETALQTQLVEQYMLPHKLTHGIYLVAWYRGAWQPSLVPPWKPGSLENARQEANAWAQAVTAPGIQVFDCVFDCSGDIPQDKR